MLKQEYEYIEQYKILHKNKNDYGASSLRYLPELKLIIEYLQPKSILDYGCGKGALSNKLKEEYPNIQIYQYDPAIEGKDVLPVEKADLVINTDVLEHVPEEYLSKVLSEISIISNKVFFIIAHTPAMDVLPNGENAHCTVYPQHWWCEQISGYFKTITPLRQRFDRLSAIATFELPLHLIMRYYKIIGKDYWEQYTLNLISLVLNANKIKRKYYFYKIISILTFNKIKKLKVKLNKYKEPHNRIKRLKGIIYDNA